MKRNDQKWTREQTIVAFNLYCKIPFNKATSSHPEVIRIAKIIGRSAGSVSMKLGNIGSIDPELKKRGVVGLINASKLDKEVWNDFHQNWEELAFESEKILNNFEGKDVMKTSIDYDSFEREGADLERLVKTRVNQIFFRQAILSAYNFSCCITGLDIPELLVASHIIPWSQSAKDRLNPRNGLCLNALHDRAFDKGLLTITTDFKVKISPKVLINPNTIINKWLSYFDGKPIALPDKFIPRIDFIQYHNQKIFQS